MTSRRTLTLDPSAGTALSYIRSRRVLRLASGAGTAEAVELPVTTFLDELGVDLSELIPMRQYLLFGGTDQRPVGGTGDIIDTFAGEPQARMAFQELRRSQEYRDGWAELVAVSATGKMQRLCWFGDRQVRQLHRLPSGEKRTWSVFRRWRASGQ